MPDLPQCLSLFPSCRQWRGVLKESNTREKHRLVFGVFGDPAALVRALGDLAAKGFTGEDLHLS